MISNSQQTRDRYDQLTPLFGELADDTIPAQRRRSVRDKLVTGHLPIAEHIAHRFRGRGRAEEDLRQVATVGLIKAVDRFDPLRGTDFLSFAVPTITGEVRRHFRDTGWLVRVPRRLQELNHLISRAVAELSNEFGRSPRPSEIAEKLAISVDEVYEGMEVASAYTATPLHGESDHDEEGGLPLADRLGTEELGIRDVEDRAVLYPALGQLPGRERTIVLMRFFGNMTQTQIAAKIHISQMHVSRLLTQSLKRLRTILLADDEEPAGW